MNNKIVPIVLALLVGLGLGYVVPHGASKPASQPVLGGMYETNPSHFANGFYAGQTDQFSVDASGNIVQSAASTAALGNIVQNAGIASFSASTTLTGAQFCANSMAVVTTSAPGPVTITLPTLAQMATSPCGANIYSGAFNQNFIVNKSNYPLTLATNGAGETIVGSNGTSATLPSGHSEMAIGGFVNTSTIPGATGAGTTFQVMLVDYSNVAGTNGMSSSSPASLGSSWLGHLVLPTGGSTIFASTTAVSSASTTVDVMQELASPIAGVTCNSTISTGTAVTILFTASSTLSGFKISSREQPVTNPYCYSYNIMN